MSTPLTAPKPDMPTGTSNPVSWKSWFTKIGDWIDGLSPAGATAHDTGDVAITAASPATAYGVGGVRSRRIGRDVKLRGNIILSAAATLTGAGGVVVGTTPHPPSSQQIQRITSQMGDLEIIITGAGVISVRNLQGSMSFASGHYISLDGVTYNAA